MIKETTRNNVHAFFHDRLGLHDSKDFRGCLYVPKEYEHLPMSMDHVAIAVAFNGFIGKTCAIHTVIQRPEMLSRSILREAFGYAFNVCGCEALLGMVDSKNEPALKMNRRLGFKEIHTVPHGGPEADLIIMQMLRQDCRWLQNH